MKVSKENCAGCVWWESQEAKSTQENMIKLDNCNRRSGGACER